MNAHLPFRDKVVLVAGGSRGIGAATARHLASLGAAVAITYRERRDAALAVVNGIAGAGGTAAPYRADVSRPEDIDETVQAVAARFGRIDVLVNTAGTSPNRPLEDIDAGFIREVFDTHVLGAILLTRAVVPFMPAPGGRIVHFSSRLAVSPMAATTVYAAAKAAVSALTLALSKELGPKGITINAIAPGLIDTDMSRAAVEQRGEAVRAATPLRRIGKPEDIVGIVAFLASPESEWITGRTLLADGGFN